MLIPNICFFLIGIIPIESVVMIGMDSLGTALGLKLLELRQEHDLTQKQLCSDLNISRANYSYFENGRRIPDLNTLLLIARYYSVSLDELVSHTTNTADNSSGGSDVSTAIELLHHFQSKNIPIEDVRRFTKGDFDFLNNFKGLSDDDKSEMAYLMNYKLRKQKK